MISYDANNRMIEDFKTEINSMKKAIDGLKKTVTQNDERSSRKKRSISNVDNLFKAYDQRIKSLEYRYIVVFQFQLKWWLWKHHWKFQYVDKMMSCS